MRRTTIVVGALAALSGTVPGQAPTAKLVDSATTLLARATPAGDTVMLKGAEALLERVVVAAPGDAWALHWLAYAVYRRATLEMGRYGKNVEVLLKRSQDLLERSEQHGTIPENAALRSGVLGMRIGTSPLRGMTLGPQSGMAMRKALSQGPDNPRVWLLRGIGAFNTPPMFGGGADNAVEYLQQALKLFSRDSAKPPAPTWGLEESHVWLGRAYVKLGKRDLARVEYLKALELEPGDVWVRTVLLPALDKQ